VTVTFMLFRQAPIISILPGAPGVHFAVGQDAILSYNILQKNARLNW